MRLARVRKTTSTRYTSHKVHLQPGQASEVMHVMCRCVTPLDFTQLHAAVDVAALSSQGCLSLGSDQETTGPNFIKHASRCARLTFLTHAPSSQALVLMIYKLVRSKRGVRRIVEVHHGGHEGFHEGH